MKDPMKDQKPQQKDANLNNKNFNNSGNRATTPNTSDVQRAGTDYQQKEKIAPNANTTGSTKSDRR